MTRRPHALVLTEAVLAITLTAVLALTAAAWPALFSRATDPVRAVLDLSAAAAVLEAILRRETHLAGYPGCLAGQADSPAVPPPALAVYAAKDRAAAPPLAQAALRRARPGSAVLLVRYLSPHHRSADIPDAGGGLPTSGDGTWHLPLRTPQAAWSVGTELLLTDCIHRAQVRVERVLQRGLLLLLRPQSAPDRAAMKQLKGPDLRLVAFVRRVFYIAKSGGKTAASDPIHGLYMRDWGKPASALLEGLENWHLHLLPASNTRPFAMLAISAELRSTQLLPGTTNPYLHRTLELHIAAYNLP